MRPLVLYGVIAATTSLATAPAIAQTAGAAPSVGVPHVTLDPPASGGWQDGRWQGSPPPGSAYVPDRARAPDAGLAGRPDYRADRRDDRPDRDRPRRDRDWGKHERFARGQTVPRFWFDDRFYVRDPFTYGLREPPYGHRWIRSYEDAVLIELASGRVIDVAPDLDWDRAYGPPRGYAGGYHGAPQGYGYGPGHGGYGYGYGYGAAPAYNPCCANYGPHSFYVPGPAVIVMKPVTRTTVTEEKVYTYTKGQKRTVRKWVPRKTKLIKGGN